MQRRRIRCVRAVAAETLRACGALLLVLAVIAPLPSSAARLIVKLRSEAEKSSASPGERVAKLAARTGAPVRYLRPMALGADVLTIDDDAEVDRTIARLARDDDVEFVQRDSMRQIEQAPPINDEFALAQTYLSDDPAAISAYSAWTVTQGSPSVVVAVIDTGYRPHAAMAGRILAGYDMISSASVANDGDGRDSDASDPGDWVSPANATNDCPVRNSTWHGTAVAGIIAANTNDHAWTAGIDWAAKVLPVRTLGICGGYDSDIVDGVAWASGLLVPGVPANPTPAEVINLSLGAKGACDPIYAAVFAAAYSLGNTRAIVVAAGNESSDVANDSPASCPGAIAVASTTVKGNLASYSNFGAGITLSAPGGSFVRLTSSPGLIVLSNTGTTVPIADSFDFIGGTSLAAPMVAGTVSLMLAVAPGLTPDQVRSILVATAKPFPAGSDCTTARCGAGIVDAGAAVRAAAAAAPPVANYEGLWWNSPAESESGWGINLAHQGDFIFATWFTYDATGKAWWLSMTAVKVGANVYSGELVQTRGPAFDSARFDPNLVTRTAVGNGKLTFTDANTAQFNYTVNGIMQTKTLIREAFGVLPICTFGARVDLAAAGNYQDLWWAAPAESESGWGINLTEQSDVIFGTWFTYDLDGTPLWLSVTASASAPNVFTGDLVRTSGPAFSAVPFDPTKVTRVTVGTATFTFGDGADGTFDYTVNGIHQVKPITREVFVPPGTLCQ